MHMFAPLAFIDGLGGPEMMLVFVLVLLLFGGQKLPEFARGLGKTMREFKKAAAGVEDEFKRALEEDERKKNETTLAAAAAVTPALLAAKDNPAAVEAADPYHDNTAHDSYYDHDHYSEAGPEVQTTPSDPAGPGAESGTVKVAPSSDVAPLADTASTTEQKALQPTLPSAPPPEVPEEKKPTPTP